MNLTPSIEPYMAHSRTMGIGARQARTLARLVALLVVLANPLVFGQDGQGQGHRAGRNVTPFDLARTIQLFRVTDSGGVERVVVKDPAAQDQVALIQQRLQQEAEAFQRGDYSDTISRHGTDMPGLKELQAAAAKVNVFYLALPIGAEITFQTRDSRLVAAIHRWFGAQMAQHGADAASQ